MSELYVVVGLGVTGVSCVRFLKQQGCAVAVTDSRLSPPQLDAFQRDYPDVTLSLGQLDESLLQRATTIVLSPGVALHEPIIAKQVQRGAKVVGDIELFANAVTVPIIAITGTNAKSTVTTLVGMMVEEAGYVTQVGGNLGIPALALLENNPQTNVFVLELSSFQLETTFSLKASVATVLNITPDHMDRYATLADYQQAKHRVYQDCRVAVCNRDDALTDTMAEKKFTFTLNVPGKNEFGLIHENGDIYLAYETEKLLSIRELPVPGKHYQANALAALAIGHGFGLPFAPMLKVLKTFKGLPHRCQWVREYQGVHWYNDSKGTNVGATQAAIEGLGSEIAGKLVLILGGVGKNADFTTIVPAVSNYARHVVLIGESAPELEKILGNHVATSRAHDMAEAIHQCVRSAEVGDCVLLSPACASFDMFKNFEHRGDVFTDIVEKL